MSSPKPRTVLVVDDQTVILELFRLLLVEDSRFAPPLLASDATRAAALVAEHQPDVVLLDVDLGREDGLELLPVVRDVAPHTAVVLFSSASRATPATVRASGADGFIPKGTDVDDVLEELLLVNRVIDLSRTGTAPQPASGTAYDSRSSPIWT